ncbi:MAG: ABC transporter ATP-binding protein [Alphaproteobacteria bacterium]
MAPLLSIRGLTTHLFTDEGVLPAVQDLDLDVIQDRTLALVGESGCGKSMTALSILRLVPDPPARIVGGRVMFEGRDLLTLPEREMRGVRGNDIAMIFQEPMTSLNPVFTVGDQIVEALTIHRNMSPREALDRAVELLELVQIPDPRARVNDYPHRLSGGMRQRVMIAMALACEPKVLIADEPTTALDVTIQAQVLDLLRDLQRRFHMGVILITHDLGVVAEVADRVVVMYAGRKVEEAPVDALFKAPRHPYTVGLLGSTPRPDAAAGRRERLQEIAGMVPSLAEMPTGCAFAPRCPIAMPACAQRPALQPVAADHDVACFAAHEPDHAAAVRS